MTALAFKLLGGIGLFLLGMALLTDGIKAFAGDALRRALVRFTGTPLKAFGSGALTTLAVQSSSATTITVIGFVSAGLIGFPQALGVVMGASLGTTGTGWIVSLLGLKVSLGTWAMPLVAIGAFLKLLASGRWRPLGLGLAGFALIFIGIDNLQAAMQGLASVFDLARLPSAGLSGHVAALGIGLLMTVVLQSSSAAVATTLTALHVGAVNFEQAASLVIGAAIGTTVTGALAAIGASVPARRTALAHVLFNAATGLVALLLLPGFLWGIGLAQRYLGLDAGALSLAAFHTAFIAIGVLLFMPMVHPFARWIERLLPDRGPELTRHLDDSLYQLPAVALEASGRALRETARELLAALEDLLLMTPSGALTVASRQAEVDAALTRIQVFFAGIPALGSEAPLPAVRVAQLHAIDHLTRLAGRLRRVDPLRLRLSDPRLHEATLACRNAVTVTRTALANPPAPGWIDVPATTARHLAERENERRRTVLRHTAEGGEGPEDALHTLDTLRWLERVAHHTWRIGHYLSIEADKPEPPNLEPERQKD
jgi:phosphate:Na+ symporter